VKELRKSTLELAVWGRLVSQDRSDEPAAMLLERIAEEKKRLVVEGKIRPEKELPAIGDGERPFELPLGWEWVRLGEIIELTSGQHLGPGKYTTDGNGLLHISGPAEFGEDHPIITKWTNH
jgi:type I restriction enzyme, S subunit